MSESPLETQKSWREMSDTELAKSFVDFNLGEVNRKIEEVRVRASGESYTPRVGGTSDADVMGMDAYDNEVTNLEHGAEESEPMDANEELNYLDQEKFEWEDDLKILSGEKGDEDDKSHVVRVHAQKERERRENLEKQTK